MKLLLRTTPSTNQLTSSVVSLLRDYGSWDDTHETFTARCWNLYLISLEAGCCGWYELMYTITKGLNSKVSHLVHFVFQKAQVMEKKGRI